MVLPPRRIPSALHAVSWSPRLGEQFILDSTIAGGIGLSSVGADRGVIGPSLLCRADRIDGHVVVTAMNTEYGYSSHDLPAQQAARPAFAESVLVHCEPVGEGIVGNGAAGPRSTQRWRRLRGPSPAGRSRCRCRRWGRRSRAEPGFQDTRLTEMSEGGKDFSHDKRDKK